VMSSPPGGATTNTLRPGGRPGIFGSWTRSSLRTQTDRNGAAARNDSSMTHKRAATPMANYDIENIQMGKNEGESIQRSAEPGSHAVSGRLGEAVRSGFHRLMPSRGSLSSASPKSSKSNRKSTDRCLQSAEPGAKDLIVRCEAVRLKCSPLRRSPGVLQDSNNHHLGVRMATLCQGDGPHELPFLRPPSRSRASTTTTTENFATPLSSMSIANDSSSFHSYPQSRPYSRAALSSHGDTRAETDSLQDSVGGDTTRNKMLHSMLPSEMGYSPSRGSCSALRTEARGGRSKAHSFLGVNGMHGLSGANGGYQSATSNSASTKVVSGGNGVANITVRSSLASV